MKKVKQVSFDILVDDTVDGYNLAEQITDILKASGYEILGADFKEDVSEFYENKI
jgi:hypothetical protein